jgi:hypothetical protein
MSRVIGHAACKRRRDAQVAAGRAHTSSSDESVFFLEGRLHYGASVMHDAMNLCDVGACIQCHHLTVVTRRRFALQSTGEYRFSRLSK